MRTVIALWVQRFLRWWFGAPFARLPLEFGEAVPPELRVFEVKAEAMQRHPYGHIPDIHTRRTRLIR